MAELKPCPFCGTDDIDLAGWTDDKGNSGPLCNGCNAMAEGVDAWNRRAGMPAPFGWVSARNGNYFTRSERIAKRIGGLIPVYATPPAGDAGPDRILALLREARTTLEMWKDVAPAVSLCADIDAAIEASKPQCDCLTCIRERGDTIDGLPHELCEMIVCTTCGNKRCPKANDHRNACTGSNEPGQPDSAYPAIAASKGEKDA